MTDLKVVIPTNCHLWKKEVLVPEDLSTLIEVKGYLYDNHQVRQLMKCSDCGQYYYKEFFETEDWVGGNDPQYRTYIPVDPTDATIDSLNAQDFLAIHDNKPRLLDDWLADNTRTVKWVGRDQDK